MLTTIKQKSTETILVKVAQYLTKFAEREKADGIFFCRFYCTCLYLAEGERTHR